jgi:hypothetical protein
MKKRVVRESQEIILSEYELDYSKGVVSLEKLFGRERTLERMIKLRESKKVKLDEEISKLNQELQERKKQIKELSKHLSPSISILRRKKYNRIVGSVYLSFGNKKSRYIQFQLGTYKDMKDKSKDELKEMTRRLFLRKIGQ